MASDSLPKLGRLRVQAVLYGNEPEAIIKTVEHLDRAAELAIAAGAFGQVTLVYGDSSPSDELRASVEDAKRRAVTLADVEYHHFGANRGSAGGHNALLDTGQTDFSILMNPDILFAPTALMELARPFADPAVGMTEPKQLPFEHPKDYSLATGETVWASGACTLVRRSLLTELNGYDAATFFLYCDDVDLSWRARLKGYKLIYCPEAAVFHDKRLSSTGEWVAGWAEKYYSAEAGLLLAYKYSRDDLVEKISSHFANSGDEVWLSALDGFNAREREGRLPERLDPNHKVAVFRDGFYARHRFI
ncbi:glycosyltransferase [Dyella sp. 333MFSha]|uniref:glycosyltransferase family 2 protein n=1 Tax=Dyella sp. 333MFSha TaxID=1798240 RepID=UPI0008801121|nr:glycosyltransferase [Dyella sp. 333MFSha]SDG47347.1 hypothetical protein SAMN04515659_2858 [Dyella sp. 333MFSha]